MAEAPAAAGPSPPPATPEAAWEGAAIGALLGCLERVLAIFCEGWSARSGAGWLADSDLVSGAALVPSPKVAVASLLCLPQAFLGHQKCWRGLHTPPLTWLEC